MPQCYPLRQRQRGTWRIWVRYIILKPMGGGKKKHDNQRGFSPCTVRKVYRFGVHKCLLFPMTKGGEMLLN